MKLFKYLLLLFLISVIYSCRSLNQENSVAQKYYADGSDDAENTFKLKLRASHRELSKRYKNLLLEGGFYQAITRLTSVQYEFCSAEEYYNHQLFKKNIPYTTAKTICINLEEMNRDIKKANIQLLKIMTDTIIDDLMGLNFSYVFRNTGTFHEGILVSVKMRNLLRHYIMGYLFMNLDDLPKRKEYIDFYTELIAVPLTYEENLLELDDNIMKQIFSLGILEANGFKKIRDALIGYGDELIQNNDQYGMRLKRFNSMIERVITVYKNLDYDTFIDKFSKSEKLTYRKCFTYFNNVLNFSLALRNGNVYWTNLISRLGGDRNTTNLGNWAERNEKEMATLKNEYKHRIFNKGTSLNHIYTIESKNSHIRYTNEWKGDTFVINENSSYTATSHDVSEDELSLSSVIWYQYQIVQKHLKGQGLETAPLRRIRWTKIKNQETAIVLSCIRKDKNGGFYIKANSPEGIAFLGTPLGREAIFLCENYWEEFKRTPYEIEFSKGSVTIAFI